MNICVNNTHKQIRSYVSCAKYSPNSYTKDSNVLRCYGITHDSSRGYMMVSEYARYGDLRQYLKKEKLIWYDKLFILRDIVKGLTVIHNTGLVHGDLHPGNVLQINDNKSKRSRKAMAMVSNIGPSFSDMHWNTSSISSDMHRNTSSISPTLSHDASEICGVIPYMAPEVLRRKGYTKATDIYSFSMIMSEVASGKQPFTGRSHDTYLILDICDGLRPTVSGPECFMKLLEKCWDVDPTRRPSAKEVCDILEKWVNEVENYEGFDGTFNGVFSVNNVRSEIARQFLIAGYKTKEISKNLVKQRSVNLNNNKGAVYTSRPLTQYITRAFECGIDL